MPHSTLDGYLGCFQFSAVKHSVFVLLKIFLYNFWYTNARICWRYISRTIIAGYRVYLFSTFPEKAQLLSKGTVTLFFLAVLVSYIFLEICPLHLQFQIYWAWKFSSCSFWCLQHPQWPLPLLFGILVLGACPERFLVSGLRAKWLPRPLSSLGSYISFQCALVISYHLVSSWLLWRRSVCIFIKHLYFLGGRAGPLLLEVTQDSSLCLMSRVQRAHQGDDPSALLLKQTPAPPTAPQLSAWNATFHKCRLDPVWRFWLKTLNPHSWAPCFPAGLAHSGLQHT